MGGHEEQDSDDDQDTEDVPPDRDGVEPGDQADTESVEQPVEEEGDAEQQDDPGRIGRVAERQVEEGVEEEGESEIDAGRPADLPHEVEPAGEPAPAGAVLAAELGRPVIKAAGGRI